MIIKTKKTIRINTLATHHKESKGIVSIVNDRKQRKPR